MCGRFTLALSSRELVDAFGLEAVPDGVSARYNIAPSTSVLALTAEWPRVASPLRWGLVPRWARDPSVGNRLINARAETVAEKPSFRDAFRRRRCLLLADGFYEWRAEGRARVPFLFRAREGAPFTMAGIWEEWTAPGNEVLRTCAIVTTRANELVELVHPRMPVIVPPAERSAWLAPGDPARDALEALLVPLPADRLEAWPVTRRVGSAVFDDPACVVPAGPPLVLPGSPR